ncbi:hypothetical protein L2E82_32756 [Cichorium intybus]|uniref:Uncharacterized protein n=1 Tax=Cichorium intybus TaxID=13427 RepID=A0ACB9BI17_CICIN|nr:hypothetical protein L2E82_32756 [Cichorium intybus]
MTTAGSRDPPLVAQRLLGKVALVTGGASGIGESIVRLFHKHGAKVCVVDINDDLGQHLCQTLGPTTRFIHGDVAIEDDMSRAVDFTVTNFGTLDIMVNNAGISGTPCPDIREFPISTFEKVFDINTKGTFIGMKHAARVMIPLKKGSIVSISSVASAIGGAGPHAYAASKHAVLGLTKSVAAELGQHGIRVNCVSPYAVLTNLALAHLPEDERTDDARAGFRAFVGKNANLQGVDLVEDDVANAVFFLASDDASTSTSLLILGGQLDCVEWSDDASIQPSSPTYHFFSGDVHASPPSSSGQFDPFLTLASSISLKSCSARSYAIVDVPKNEIQNRSMLCLTPNIFLSEIEMTTAGSRDSPLVAQRLLGKVALVTGGATGIGESIVRLFHKHGAKVCVVDINDDLGQHLCQTLGPTTRFIHGDVAIEDDVSRAVDFTVANFGTLDIMVNNAGIGGPPCPDIREFPISNFEKVFDINTKGTFIGMKHAARVMIPSKKGSIVSISSVTSAIGGAGPHAYTASKHAVLGLTKSVAAELGQHGIRVNCVSPYAILTNLALAHLHEDERTDDARAGFRAFIGKNANLQGVDLVEDDVANAVLFLASDDARYISGDNLFVDGGFTCTNHSLRVFR